MQPADNSLPGVTAAQFHSFARRMPSYYASVISMMLAIMLVFHGLAPAWLAVGLPSSITLLGLWRGWWWIEHRYDPVTDAEAKRFLRRSTVTLIAAFSVVIGMDVRLFGYGDIYTRVFLLIQILSCATCGFYCLMHLRKVALVVFAGMMLPFAVMTVSLGYLSTSVAALTSLITGGVMIAAMLGYEQDFLSLVKAEAATRELSRENLRLAHVDALTGLPNRRYFFEQLDADGTRSRPQPALPTLGIIDLDGFKPVNDTYGHRVGDRVLEIIASRLKTISGMEHVCRLGGDEFVFRTAETRPEHLHALGQEIAQRVGQSVELDHRVIAVGCSLGFAVRDSGSSNTQDDLGLFEQADYALYHAKRTGRARTVLFSDEHQSQIREWGVLEQALRNAELETEFSLVYQPITNVRTGAVVAFECLARWNSPVLGRVSPARFIPAAEQAGRLPEITRHLMRRALEFARQWPEEIHLSFNVCPNEIASPEQIQSIMRIVRQSGIAPGRVGIELTETALLNRFEEVSANMALLRQTGLELYLDDFGTGHSSLSYIHTLPLDKVKVDRSFVQNLETSRAGASIIRSIVALCRDLEIDCVVEGVETAAQLRRMQDLNAELIQGYFFSRPLPEDQVMAYLAACAPALQLA